MVVDDDDDDAVLEITLKEEEVDEKVTIGTDNRITFDDNKENDLLDGPAIIKDDKDFHAMMIFKVFEQVY